MANNKIALFTCQFCKRLHWTSWRALPRAKKGISDMSWAYQGFGACMMLVLPRVFIERGPHVLLAWRWCGAPCSPAAERRLYVLNSSAPSLKLARAKVNEKPPGLQNLFEVVSFFVGNSDRDFIQQLLRGKQMTGRRHALSIPHLLCNGKQYRGGLLPFH